MADPGGNRKLVTGYVTAVSDPSATANIMSRRKALELSLMLVPMLDTDPKGLKFGLDGPLQFFTGKVTCQWGQTRNARRIPLDFFLVEDMELEIILGTAFPYI
ncbi:hypothetical protein ACO1O0_006142 [Amphichorda felina]